MHIDSSKYGPRCGSRWHACWRLNIIVLSLICNAANACLLVTAEGIFLGIIFDLFGLDIKALLAGAGILGLAIGFGAQGLVSDVVTGFFILLERQIDVDDYVTVADYDGIVEEIGLRTTRLRGFDGTLYYIPNREIGSVSNHSRGNMQALVDIAINCDTNIDEAIKQFQQACDALALTEEAIIEGPDVIGVESLDSSEAVLRVICKTKNMQQWDIERKLRKVLKKVLDDLTTDLKLRLKNLAKQEV